MLQFDLTAQVRDTFGKGSSRRLRMDGVTPAILYGNNTEAVPLQLDTKELTQTMLKVQRRNAVYNLHVAGKTGDQKVHHVMVKEIQTEPVSDALVHADFCALDLEKPMVFTVPVNFVGKAKGVDMGGDMTIFTRTLVLKGRPLDIPEYIEKDISDLGLDEKYTCADFAIPANVELLSDKDAVAITVVMPVRAAVVEEAPAAGKGKKKK